MGKRKTSAHICDTQNLLLLTVLLGPTLSPSPSPMAVAQSTYCLSSPVQCCLHFHCKIKFCCPPPSTRCDKNKITSFVPSLGVEFNYAYSAEECWAGSGKKNNPDDLIPKDKWIVQLGQREVWTSNELHCFLKWEGSCHGNSLCLCPHPPDKCFVTEPQLEPERQILNANKHRWEQNCDYDLCPFPQTICSEFQLKQVASAFDLLQEIKGLLGRKANFLSSFALVWHMWSHSCSPTALLGTEYRHILWSSSSLLREALRRHRASQAPSGARMYFSLLTVLDQCFILKFIVDWSGSTLS